MSEWKDLRLPWSMHPDPRANRSWCLYDADMHLICRGLTRRAAIRIVDMSKLADREAKRHAAQGTKR